MVNVVAKLLVKEGQRNKVSEIAKKLIDLSKEEKGCLEYSFYEDINDLQVMTFIEKWQSIEDLEIHFETEHFNKLVPEIEELTDTLEVNIYKKL